MADYKLHSLGSDRAKILSESITFLKFPLAVLVVILHCDLSTKQYELLGITANEINNPVYSIVSWVLSRYIAYAAVPCFFVISGFLLFYNIDSYNRSVYIGKLKKRCKSLLVPYILWNIIYLVLYIIIGQENIVLSEVPALFGQGQTILGFIVTVFIRPLDGPLWFIRNLFAMQLLSPVIYFIIKRTKYLLPFSLLVLTQIVHNPIIESFLWFSFGVSFAVHNFDYLYFCYKWITLIFTIAIISVVSDFILYPQISVHITNYFSIFKIMTVFGIGYWCVSKLPGISKHSVLNNSSFTLYAYHALAVMLLIPYIYKLFKNLNLGDLLFTYFASIAIIVIGGILLSIIINSNEKVRMLLSGR